MLFVVIPFCGPRGKLEKVVLIDLIVVATTPEQVEGKPYVAMAPSNLLPSKMDVRKVKITKSFPALFEVKAGVQQCRIISIPFITSLLVPFSNKFFIANLGPGAINFGHDLGARIKSCLGGLSNPGWIWANLIFGYEPACWGIQVMLYSLIKCDHKMFNKVGVVQVFSGLFGMEFVK